MFPPVVICPSYVTWGRMTESMDVFLKWAWFGVRSYILGWVSRKWWVQGRSRSQLSRCFGRSLQELWVIASYLRSTTTTTTSSTSTSTSSSSSSSSSSRNLTVSYHETSSQFWCIATLPFLVCVFCPFKWHVRPIPLKIAWGKHASVRRRCNGDPNGLLVHESQRTYMQW